MMTGFARALRANGVAADPTRLTTVLDALTHIDALDAEQVYWAGRVCLCAEPDDLPRYDAVFDAWFRGRLPALPGPTTDRVRRRRSSSSARSAATPPGEDEAETDDEVLRTAASDSEVLRSKDVAGLTAAERDEIDRLIALLAPRVGSAANAADEAPRARPGGRATHRARDAARRRRAGHPGPAASHGSSPAAWSCCST